MSGCSDPPSSTKVGRRFRPPLRSPALLLLARPASPVTTQTHSEVITVSSDLFGAASAEVHRDASSKQVRTHTPTLTLNIPGGNLDSTSLSPHTPGSVRLLSSLAGSARSSCVDLLNPPLPNQAFERPLLTPRDEGDVPLNTASTSGSYFPSLRRQISNLSLRSATSSIKRFVFGPDASLPQIETTPALGKIESSKAQALTDSLEIVVEASKVPVPVIFEPSGSSPVLVNVNTESPKSTFLVDLPESEAKPPQNTLHCSPPIEKFGDTPVEGPPFSQIGLPRSIAIPPRRELQTPSRSQPLTPYSASSISTMNSPGFNRKSELNRGALASSSRTSLDILHDRASRLSIGSQPYLATSGDETEADIRRKRERGWGTGRPVPKPGQSEDNRSKRHPSLNRGPGRSHRKTLSGGASESEQKPVRKQRTFRAGSGSQRLKARVIIQHSTPNLSPIADTRTIEPALSAERSLNKSSEIRFGVSKKAPATRSVPKPARAYTISSNMSARAIITQLVDNGCSDVTHKLDLARCGELPITGGGFGDVYQGKLTNGARVAIKCPRLFLQSNDNRNNMVKNIAREIYAWSKLKHPNILPLIGLATFKNQISIVSPWMKNGTLRDYIAKNEDVDRFRLCADISAGLAHLHNSGVVHGDMKGMNVLISANGVPKLTDFGNTVLKKYTIEFTGGSTTALKVSVRWTAPELFKGEESFTKPGDVFALGMVFFEVVTGEIPFENKPEHIVGTLIVTGQTPEIPEELESLDQRQVGLLRQLMHRCWKQDPTERPDASQVAQEASDCRV